MEPRDLITILLSGDIAGGSITNIISPPIEFEHIARQLELQLIPKQTAVEELRAYAIPFWTTGLVPGVSGSFIPDQAEPLLPTPNISVGEVNTRYPAIIITKYYSASVIPIQTPVERYTQYGINIANPNIENILIQAILYLQRTEQEK